VACRCQCVFGGGLQQNFQNGNRAETCRVKETCLFNVFNIFTFPFVIWLKYLICHIILREPVHFIR
jgi:hypothetical protein